MSVKNCWKDPDMGKPNYMQIKTYLIAILSSLSPTWTALRQNLVQSMLDFLFVVVIIVNY
jgi:hypothetical protein